MKTAMELSWVVAKCFIGKDNFPVFLSAEKIEFIHPVSIGTIVEFSGRVVHSTEGMFVIQVLANEIDPDSGSKLATNKLTYIYQASATPECHYSEGAEHLGVTPVKVPYLMPREYEEFIAHLEGKRALDHYIESKGKPAGC
jgi:acyl-coenzyme A thioesterase 9